MKTNLDKCHLLLSTTEAFNFQISETVIHNSHSRKLLGVTFDNKLKFQKHITTTCQNTNRKLNALPRRTSYMDLQKRREKDILLFGCFIAELKINRLHECCLRIVYNDKTSTFNELLEKDNYVSIHHRNIQALAIEIFKVANGMPPVIMNEIFQLKEESHYNLRYTSNFAIQSIHSVYHGSESVSYLRPKIWELIPPVIRQIESFIGFKKERKKLKPTNCSCRICKSYIASVGFL